MKTTTAIMEEFKPIKIEGLYDKAYRAHLNTSFYPEKRAETYVKEYEGELNADLQSMPEGERPEYVQRYTRHLFAWLSAKSNCLSSMITGPARFPVARAEKANRTETNRYNDFREWRNKTLKRIGKRIEEAKSPEQKANERWEVLKKEISQKIAWGSVANCYSMLERLAYNGEVELVKESLILITEYNDTHERPFMTSRHKVWKLPEIAERVRESKAAKAERDNEESEINGVRVVNNFQTDRLQLYFDGKPAANVIMALKKSAFKWSPSNGCWQRQLTSNAIHAANQLLTANNQ